MKRRQLIELEDQPWLPDAIRDGITDFLQFAATRAGLYRAILPLLERCIETLGVSRILDLCAGAGGAWSDLAPRLASVREGRLRIRLTDRYPNRAAWARELVAGEGCIEMHPDPVDAMAVPEGLDGLRTLFSAFHHFAPAEARAILADATRAGQGILIVESTQRHPLVLLYMCLTPLLVLLATPLMRPLSPARLFWTYVVPAIPLAVCFDGLVSTLRTYSPEELLALAEGLDEGEGEGRYRWEAGIAPFGPLPVGLTYLIGCPEPDAAGR